MYIHPCPAGYSMAVSFTHHEPYRGAETYLLSPFVNITSQRCLSFKYFVRANLNVSLVNDSGHTTLAYFNISSGERILKAFLELPMGRYRVMWKVKYDAMAAQYFRNVIFGDCWAIIDNIMVHNKICSDLGRISSLQIIYFSRISCQKCYLHSIRWWYLISILSSLGLDEFAHFKSPSLLLFIIIIIIIFIVIVVVDVVVIIITITIIIIVIIIIIINNNDDDNNYNNNNNNNNMVIVMIMIMIMILLLLLLIFVASWPRMISYVLG